MGVWMGILVGIKIGVVKGVYLPYGGLIAGGVVSAIETVIVVALAAEKNNESGRLLIQI